MSALTMFEDIPTTSGSEITVQVLKYTHTDYYDLGDLTAYLKFNLASEDFETYWNGVQILLQTISEKDEANHVEVKLVVSPVKV
jgi:hypothetical protein